ncbi:glutamine-hydrolyzing carbamoyl-phosphate synthase small subunit [Reichenbachiella sp. MALMAid0571]|uniref:glutamine-hydrolyzing carbamoyl-phosphate synthase small subunit n=1 Tax=Reichenbachiella sp. MALMAid0571 TaxID=3143939 RepID=UPI0032DEC527
MKYQTREKAILLLEDGTVFTGTSVGKKGTSGGEICFNTGMQGYQEIYTDPSYFGQIVVNTTAHIGNYGALNAEQESDKPKINGLVVNEFSDIHSRFNADESLNEYLNRNNTVGISDIDSRKLVRYIRSKGAMNAVISSDIFDEKELMQRLKEIPSMENLELSSKVTVDTPYILGEENDGWKVAVLDLGVKKSILTNFTSRNIICKVFPAHTTFEELQAWNPDGYFISNGPGDPSAMPYAVETVKKILDINYPLFGICLGHQVIALANGISTYKMHHGHRGLNHPVKNLVTGLSEITSQNHGFAVSKEEVEASDLVTLTHINLNDDTVAGISINNKNAFSVQHHPEASPGPHDSRYLFDDFINLIKKHKEK